jgi:hypothetical protein
VGALWVKENINRVGTHQRAYREAFGLGGDSLHGHFTFASRTRSSSLLFGAAAQKQRDYGNGYKKQAIQVHGGHPVCEQ